MKSVIGWIKSNLVTVISILLMLASIGVIGWSIMRGGAAAETASADLNKMVTKLDGYSKVSVPFPPADVDAPPEEITGVTINPATLKRLDDVYGKMTREYEQVIGPILAHNKQGHNLLVPGVLPTTDASHLRHEARTAYRKAFEDMMEPYEESQPDAARLNAISPLNPAELQFELQRVEEGYRPLGLGATGANAGGLTEADRKALDEQKSQRAQEMLVERARQAHIYADTSIQSPGFPFQVGAWSLATGLPTLKQIWEGHQELWVQQDIVRAIGVANNVDQPDNSVIDSPVKRLISITVIPGNVGTTTMGGMGKAGEDKAAASGGAGMYGGGYGAGGFGEGGYGAMQGAGAYGDPGMSGMPGAGGAAPVASAGSPDQALNVNFHTGPSGRVSNAIYDVIHARVVMVVDYQKLPQLFNAISEVNFMTVLDCQIQDVDEYAALLEGYVYGSGDAVRVDMLIETIWLRDWTVPLMPAEVKQAMGLGDPGAVVAPEEAPAF